MTFDFSLFRNFEAVWNASIDLLVPMVECGRPGQPCSLHPDLCPVVKIKGEKMPRASMCNARDVLKRRFQESFYCRLGLRFMVMVSGS